MELGFPQQRVETATKELCPVARVDGACLAERGCA